MGVTWRDGGDDRKFNSGKTNLDSQISKEIDSRKCSGGQRTVGQEYEDHGLTSAQLQGVTIVGWAAPDLTAHGNIATHPQTNDNVR